MSSVNHIIHNTVKKISVSWYEHAYNPYLWWRCCLLVCISLRRNKKKNKSRLFQPHKKKSAQSILYIPMYPTHMYPRCGSISSCCCCLYRRRRYMYRRRRYTAWVLNCCPKSNLRKIKSLCRRRRSVHNHTNSLSCCSATSSIQLTCSTPR